MESDMMVKGFFILVIWFGTGSTQVFDTSRYETRGECEAVKMAITSDIKDEFGYSHPFVKCVEVNP